MPTFAEAMKKADATGLPVVEGFAVQVKPGVDATNVIALLENQLPGHSWTSDPIPVDWWICRSRSTEAPSLGQAWETVRALQELPGIVAAEPLLLARLPVATETEAKSQFSLWGRIADDRLKQIQDQSNDANRHWSLVQMGVCDASGQGGAWAAWIQEHPGEEPGAGILVAHPDTGYTAHPRLLPRLATRPGDPAGHHGRNFVEPNLPDAATNGLDPLKDRSLGKFPGHGTGTASVIATGHEDLNHPWGVAPGARLIPLRVSSSVIHLSFQNLALAIDEAIVRRAHVISMSLGGPFGMQLLNAQIRRALDAGILVISAAGNDAPTVVFPALIPGVLACAASNVLAAPWRFSGLGSEVAITAPGELAWHDQARLDPSLPEDAQARGSGTSFATANVAGLAALWLSFHGRQKLIDVDCGGQPGLLPFLFRLCIKGSADASPKFIRDGHGGFGAGIARADQLLKMTLPKINEIKAERERVLDAPISSVVNFPAGSWRNILTLPTLAEGEARLPSLAEVTDRKRHLLAALDEVVGSQCDDHDIAEIGALSATDLALQNALDRACRSPQSQFSGPLRRYLLRDESPLSDTLREKLEQARKAVQREWIKSRPELQEGKDASKTSKNAKKRPAKIAYAVEAPPTRRLRAYAFDPSLANQSADVAINEITIPIVFERKLTPGPVGDYLEVVDVDPASDCAYAPVDLDHPFLLAQDGLPRSEGNPQFHQQMVYAVAMKTIGHFEEALGRPIFWSCLRPWKKHSGDAERVEKPAPSAKKGAAPPAAVDLSDRYVQHLRLYPHAMRDQNAYYSPQKRAILFGYFPAGDTDPGAEYPGGVIFTCLAHDIVAHETTHAILDGMHAYFIEATNPDVLAFHEAFADIVALFQRFTYPELLRNQIARVRGRLDAGSLMTQLALQFGAAIGRHQPLRDALGHVVRQARRKREDLWHDRPDEPPMDGGAAPVTLADAARDLSDVQTRELWQRFRADPNLLQEIQEPHERGSVLVAAVFDAYLTIYENRVSDLKRIATGGTGILPEGDLHPDLVGRMADEAALSARHVLRMCLRAMDYVPPLDITFGEFLRALITADFDLVPDDERRYRVAFVEAFRKWGIYPRNVRTLSEETLRWSPPEIDKLRFKGAAKLRRALLTWQPGSSREAIFKEIHSAQAALHAYLADDALDPKTKKSLLGGIDTRLSFQVTNLRPARRIGLRGEFLTEMVVEVLQNKDALPTDPTERLAEKARRKQVKAERQQRGEVEETGSLPFRGGVTLVISLDDYRVRYSICKRVDNVAREERQRSFRAAADGSGGAAEYSSDGLPPGWFSEEAQRKVWLLGRNSKVEDMRASSCDCRRQAMSAKAQASDEPFALLHRG
ncbi:MAG: S8 family serine peptidase [Acidobacteriota bacterium]